MTVLIIIVIIFFLIGSSKQNKPENSNSNNALVRDISYASATQSEILSLIEQGADLEAHAFGSGATPLMRAAYVGRNDLVQILLDAGANINARDNTGSTPIMIAAMQDQVDTCKLLIDAGANLSLKDNQGQSVEDYTNNNDILSYINNFLNTEDIDEYISLFMKIVAPCSEDSFLSQAVCFARNNCFARNKTMNLKIFDSINVEILNNASYAMAIFIISVIIKNKFKKRKFIGFVLNNYERLGIYYNIIMLLIAQTGDMAKALQVLFGKAGDFEEEELRRFSMDFFLDVSAYMGGVMQENGYPI